MPSRELSPEVYSALLSGQLLEANPDTPEKGPLLVPVLVSSEELCLASKKTILKKEDIEGIATEDPITIEAHIAIEENITKNLTTKKKYIIMKRWNKKILLKTVCIFSIISFLSCEILPPAESQNVPESPEEPIPQTIEKETTIQQDLKEQTSVIDDLKDLASHRLWRDFKYVITWPERLDKSYLLPIIGAGALIGGLMAADQAVRKYTRNHHNQQTNDFFSDYIDPLGDGRYGAAICGLFYFGGKIFDNQRAKETGIMGIESMAVAGALSSIGKLLIGRERPKKNKGAFYYQGVNSKSYKSSLPSGHTTMAFSLASVIAEQYENILIDILAYGAASAVGFQRVYDDDHWLSDVAAGAILGIVVGKTIVNLNRNDSPIKVKPVIDTESETTGVALNLEF
jgi:hypothetical protein